MGKKCKEIGIPVYINSGTNQISGSNPNSGEIKILTERINKMGSKLGFAIGELKQMRFQFGSLRSTRFGSTETEDLIVSVTALEKAITTLESEIKKKMDQANAALAAAKLAQVSAETELASAKTDLSSAKDALVMAQAAAKSGDVSAAEITRLTNELKEAQEKVKTGETDLSSAKTLVKEQTDRINGLAKRLGDILK